LRFEWKEVDDVAKFLFYFFFGGAVEEGGLESCSFEIPTEGLGGGSCADDQCIFML